MTKKYNKCCAFVQKENEELKKENDKMKRIHEEMKREVRRSQDIYIALEEENIKLKEEIKTLQAALASANKKIKELENLLYGPVPRENIKTLF